MSCVAAHNVTCGCSWKYESIACAEEILSIVLVPLNISSINIYAFFTDEISSIIPLIDFTSLMK